MADRVLYLYIKEWGQNELTWDDVITFGDTWKETVIPYPATNSKIYNIITGAPDLDIEYINNSGTGIFATGKNPSSIKWNCYMFTDSANNRYRVDVFGAIIPEGSSGTHKVFGAEHLLDFNPPRKYNRLYTLDNSWYNGTTGHTLYYYALQQGYNDVDYTWREVPILDNIIFDSGHPYNPQELTEALHKCLRAMDDDNWENDEDPYDPGGSSKPGGGGGTFDDDSDPIDFPSLPILSAVVTGFVNLYNPTLSQIQDLSRYLWGNLFDINQWKRLFADPMDAIIGLSIVPVSVPNSGPVEITVGNIPTGIYANRASAQWVTVDCGYIDVEEYFGAYLDYTPYTKFQLFLPFIGIVDIDTDDIMASRVHIKYNVDVLTGSCVAFVKVTKGELERILYTFNGQCAVNIPFTSNDWTNALNSLITLGATAISGKVGAGLAIGSQLENNDDVNPFQIGQAIRANSSASAGLVTNSKINVKRGGSLSTSVGLMGRRKPYLIRTNPKQCRPKKQANYTGYPSYIRVKLGDCSGFTIIEEMHLENIHATESELNEIESILKSGVYI